MRQPQGIESDSDDDIPFLNDEDYERTKINKKRKKEAMHYQYSTDSFYIACYGIQSDSIYFVNFFTNEIVSSNVQLTHQEKKYKKRINTLRYYWHKIEHISGFNGDSYISEEAKAYFKRPINSHFLFTETKGLFSSNNCSPMPCVFKTYGSIRISVTAHLSLFDSNSEENDVLKDFVYEDNITFLFVIDSIISTTINKLTAFLSEKIEEEKNKDKTEEEVAVVDNELASSSQNNKEGIAFKNYRDSIEEAKTKKEYKFVLKLQGFEEYLYGDNAISSYECIRQRVRQFETLRLVLFKKAMFDIAPPLSRYPPLIYFPPDEVFTYFDLLDKYIAQYPDECAVFRYGEPGEKENEQFTMKQKQRMDKVLQYGESGDCDFPLQVTLYGVFNLQSIFKWLNNEKYSKNEMMLYYFNDDFETKEQYEESLVKNKMLRMFGCAGKKVDPVFEEETKGMSEKEKKKKEKEREKDRQKEKKEKNKALSLISKSNKENIKLQRNLNFLRINKKDDTEKNNIIKNKFSVYTTFSNELFQKTQELETTPFYKDVLPTDKHFKYSPVFLRVSIDLLYGSFPIEKLTSMFYVISNSININETFTFNNNSILISNLPREARLGITLSLLNKEKSSPIEVGSCQVPLFKEDGFFNDSDITIPIWPFFKVEPRVNCCEPFTMKLPLEEAKKTKEKKFVDNIFNLNNDQSKISESTARELINPNTSGGYQRKSQIVNFNQNTNIDTKKEIKPIIIKDKKDDSDDDDDDYIEYPPFKETKIDERNYCYINIGLQKFNKSLVHRAKDPMSYKQFLKLKKVDHEHESIIDRDNDVFGGMLYEMSTILNEMKESVDDETYNNEEDNEMIEASPASLTFPLIEKNLSTIDNVIKRDALNEITADERRQVIICRDYISTLPRAIDVFLRSINWFNPIQSFIAHLYLKKWAKLEPEDAIGLLDSRFPDTQVRELAIKSLESAPDDIIELYIMELCQCLFYESYLLSPLADFLIEKSLKNQQLIGNKFFWFAKVATENMMFKNRLNIILAQMFMMSGPKFIDDIEMKLQKTDEYKSVSRTAKEIYGTMPNDKVRERVNDLIKKWIHDGNFNFALPIHPSYYVAGYNVKKIKVFDSKMVPIMITLKSTDGSNLSVIFKIGDDLRQDVLILQMLKIMDKLWLDNDLDLKISTYNVCPIELKCGFVEFVNAKVLESVQKDEGAFLGALDRRLLYNYLNNSTTEDKLILEKRIDNFIRSLAGYCVATGVLGIGDRHSANVMIKNNGLFLHIDFGHIFGNFKMKCGFKRERSRFLLTPDMAYVYMKSNNEEKFKNYCVKAYNILRHNGQRLLNLIITMSSAGMPEYSTIADLAYFQKMLQLDIKNDDDAGNYYLALIRESVNERYRILDNLIHNCIHID